MIVVAATLVFGGCATIAAPEQKKPTTAYARPQKIVPPKTEKAQSWGASLLQPEDAKRPKKVEEWMDRERTDL